jgi:hypothetical protein
VKTSNSGILKGFSLFFKATIWRFLKSWHLRKFVVSCILELVNLLLLGQLVLQFTV